MVVTYHRVGTGAVLAALVAAGMVIVVGGIGVTIAVATLAVMSVLRVGVRLAHALGLRQTTPAPAGQADTIIDGVVVHRAPAVD